MKRVIILLILAIIVILTLTACATEEPSSSDTLVSQALPLESPLPSPPTAEISTPLAAKQAAAAPYILSDKFSEFPLDYLPNKLVTITPLIIDDRYERDGQLLWFYFWSHPQFFHMDPHSDGSATDAINKYYQDSHTDMRDAAELEKQKKIESYDRFFAQRTEDNPEKPISTYTIAQYKTAATGTYSTYSAVYNVLNVFCVESTYVGGAHMFDRLSCAVFSLKTGSCISLADLFAVDEEIYIKRLCDEMYAALENGNHRLIIDESETQRENLNSLFKLFIADNLFALSENGLIIMFDPYSMGGLVGNEAWITIPYECIQDIMIPLEDIVNIAP